MPAKFGELGDIWVSIKPEIVTQCLKMRDSVLCVGSPVPAFEQDYSVWLLDDNFKPLFQSPAPATDSKTLGEALAKAFAERAGLDIGLTAEGMNSTVKVMEKIRMGG
jgi:hypothetical protein